MPSLTSPLRLAARSTAPLLTRPTTTSLSLRTRPFSSSQHIRSASESHESKYDPPSGWLWGVKPGEKYEKEGWETVYFWGMGISVTILVVGYAYKPDTSIQTWALEEARRRLEKEGILVDPTEPKEDK